MTQTMSESALLEDRDLRTQMIQHVKVLDRVRALFLIPGLNMLCIQQVAKYFDVDVSTIRKCYNRNRDEINQDGVIQMGIQDFLTGQFVTAKKTERGRTIFSLPSGEELVLSNGTTTYFSANAVLRLSMLLDDNTVAKEIRTQIMHLIRGLPPQARVMHIDHEKQLVLDIIFEKDEKKRVASMNEYAKLNSEKHAVLEAEVHGLASSNAILANENESFSRQNMKWTDRAMTERMVRMFANKAYKDFVPFHQKLKMAWQKFYSELYYDERIALKLRRKEGCIVNDSGDASCLLNYVRAEEWPILVRKAYSMCRRIGCNVEMALRNDVVFQRILACDRGQAVPIAVSYEILDDEETT